MKQSEKESLIRSLNRMLDRIEELERQVAALQEGKN